MITKTHGVGAKLQLTNPMGILRLSSVQLGFESFYLKSKLLKFIFTLFKSITSFVNCLFANRVEEENQINRSQPKQKHTFNAFIKDQFIRLYAPYFCFLIIL